MSNYQQQQSSNDAAQGKGPKSTNGISYQDANSFNFGYKGGKK